jgi:hypothetical protein
MHVRDLKRMSGSVNMGQQRRVSARHITSGFSQFHPYVLCSSSQKIHGATLEHGSCCSRKRPVVVPVLSRGKVREEDTRCHVEVYVQFVMARSGFPFVPYAMYCDLYYYLILLPLW